jgi:hypothetical protein
MIAFTLFEFASDAGKGVITKWLKKHPTHRPFAKAKTDRIRKYGVGSEETLSFCCHEGDGIWKLKVRGATPEFRPHLCKGPLQMEAEATFLATAIEEDFELDPSDVKKTAIARRSSVKDDPGLRIDLKL